MFNFSVKIMVIVIVQNILVADALNSLSESKFSGSRSLGILVNSKNSESGKWLDTIDARAEHSDNSRNISVEVRHNVTKCDGKRVIHIQGYIENGNTEFDQKIAVNKIPPIAFQLRHGSNVILSKNGRTIEKKNLDVHKYGTAITNRTLGNNELFEVRLDQKGKRSSQSFGIGVLTKIPENLGNIHYTFNAEFAWMYYNNAIYHNGSELKKYGLSLNDLPGGTKFGVMKKPSGDVHFFINETDQGTAVSGISDPVYAAVELFYNAEKVTILSP